MPVQVTSDDSTGLLVPAPTVTFSKAYLKRGDGRAIGAEYTINLTGQLLDNKGSPVASGIGPTVSHGSGVPYSTQDPDDDPLNADATPANQLTSIMKKQELVRQLFGGNTENGYKCGGNRVLLQITGYNASDGIQAYCDVDSIDFDDQSRWTNRCGYTVTLKAARFTESSTSVFGNNDTEDDFDHYISATDESWSIQENDQFHTTFTGGGAIDEIKRLYTLTHNASAVGQRIYVAGQLEGDLEPWERAKAYVLDSSDTGLGIGLGKFSLTGHEHYVDPINGGMLYNAYNHKLTENVDKGAGSYSISEEWTLFESGTAPDEFAVEDVTFSIDSDQSAIRKVSINGTVQGLAEYGTTSETTDKYSNALAYYNANCTDTTLFDRASTLSGFTCLNSSSSSKGIGHNPNAGTITYSLSFDTRPGASISGALTEDIQVSDIYPGQLISVTPVIGRSQPIIQYVNSRSEFKKTLQVTAQMAQDTGTCQFTQPPTGDIISIYNDYVPTAVAVAGKVFYGPPNESWNPTTGQYSYSVEWTYERA